MDIARIMASHLSVALTNAELYRVLTEREDDLRHQAAHDPLTGLANRVSGGERIDEALAAAATGAVASCSATSTSSRRSTTGWARSR